MHGSSREAQETRPEGGGRTRGHPTDSSGLPRLTHAATAAATIAAIETHVRLKTMYDFHVGDHIVFSGEFFRADRTGVVLDIRLVRGDVMSAKVADVCVRAMTYGATINVALFYAKVSHRALRALVLNLERAFKVALTDFRLAGHHTEYGTAYAVLRLRFQFGVRVLLLLLLIFGHCHRRGGRRGLTLQRRRAEFLAKASLKVDADMSRRFAAIATARRLF